MKIRCMRGELIHAEERRKDRHDEAYRRFSQICELA